jgi:hypothetical protein
MKSFVLITIQKWLFFKRVSDGVYLLDGYYGASGVGRTGQTPWLAAKRRRM